MNELLMLTEDADQIAKDLRGVCGRLTRLAARSSAVFESPLTGYCKVAGEVIPHLEGAAMGLEDQVRRYHQTGVALAKFVQAEGGAV